MVCMGIVVDVVTVVVVGTRTIQVRECTSTAGPLSGKVSRSR